MFRCKSTAINPINLIFCNYTCCCVTKKPYSTGERIKGLVPVISRKVQRVDKRNMYLFDIQRKTFYTHTNINLNDSLTPTRSKGSENLLINIHGHNYGICSGCSIPSLNLTFLLIFAMVSREKKNSS